MKDTHGEMKDTHSFSARGLIHHHNNCTRSRHKHGMPLPDPREDYSEFAFMGVPIGPFVGVPIGPGIRTPYGTTNFKTEYHSTRLNTVQTHPIASIMPQLEND